MEKNILEYLRQTQEAGLRTLVETEYRYELISLVSILTPEELREVVRIHHEIYLKIPTIIDTFVRHAQGIEQELMEKLKAQMEVNLKWDNDRKVNALYLVLEEQQLGPQRKSYCQTLKEDILRSQRSLNLLGEILMEYHQGQLADKENKARRRKDHNGAVYYFENHGMAQELSLVTSFWEHYRWGIRRQARIGWSVQPKSELIDTGMYSSRIEIRLDHDAERGFTLDMVKSDYPYDFDDIQFRTGHHYPFGMINPEAMAKLAEAFYQEKIDVPASQESERGNCELNFILPSGLTEFVFWIMGSFIISAMVWNKDSKPRAPPGKRIFRKFLHPQSYLRINSNPTRSSRRLRPAREFSILLRTS